MVKRLLISLCLLLASCQPQKGDSRPLRLNLFNEPPTLDPRRARDITSETVILVLYEGLTRLDSEGRATLASAKSYTVSNNGLTYTFTLRSARWNNGDRVSANDFVSAWSTVLDPTFPSERPELLAILRSFHSPRSDTLVVELKEPYPYFLELIAAPTYSPYHDGATNGPFEIQFHQPNDRLVLTKSPTYWDAQHVYLPAIEMYTVEDKNTELAMFEQGELDWIGMPLSCIPYDAVPRLRASGALRSTPANKVYWYQFNPETPPFNHPKIRRAFSLAIDREQIITHITRDTHRLPTGLLPTTPGTPLVHDPEQARALLAEGLAELELDTCPPIVLALNTGEDHLQIAQAVQRQWQRTLSVEAELRIADWQVHLDRLSRGDYMVARYAYEAILPDASDILDYLSRTYPETKPTEQKLLEQMVVAPLFFVSNNHLAHPNLTGVVIPPTGRPDFKSARLGGNGSKIMS
jgi:oligopeptide transport system substrate-binding protein